MYHLFLGLLITLVGVPFVLPTHFKFAHGDRWEVLDQPLFGLGGEIISIGLIIAIYGLWKRRDLRIPASVWPAIVTIFAAMLLVTWEGSDFFQHRRANYDSLPPWIYVGAMTVCSLLVIGLLRGWRWGRLVARWGSLGLVGYAWYRAWKFEFLSPPFFSFSSHSKFDTIVETGFVSILLIGVGFYLLRRPTAEAYLLKATRDVSGRRRYQFSLRTMLLVNLGIMFPLGWIADFARPYRMRAAAVTRLKQSELVKLEMTCVCRGDWLDRIVIGDVRIDHSSWFVLKGRPTDEMLNDMQLLSATDDHEIIDVRYPLDDDDLLRILSTQSNVTLQLDRPAVTHKGWAAIAELPNLTKFGLEIHHADFDDEDLARIAHKLWPRIEFVDTKITGLALARLLSSEGGVIARLDGSPVTDEGLHSMRTASFAHLRLARTKITGASLADLEHLDEAIYIDLSDTAITDKSLKALEKAKMAYWFVFSGCHISGEGIRHLANHDSISILRLDRTTITDDDLADVACIKKIKALSLAKTTVTAKGLRQFVGHTEIEKLDLRGITLDEQGLRELVEITGLERVTVDPNVEMLAKKVFAEEQLTITFTSTEPDWEFEDKDWELRHD